MKILLRELKIPFTSVDPEEKGADVVVTFADGSRVGVEVTEPFLTDDGRSPQARASRWKDLWARLQDAVHAAGFKGLILIEFKMEGGWPAMPPSRDFDAIVSEVTDHAKKWVKDEEAVVRPAAGSVLAASVAWLTFTPSPINDVSSNHQTSFLPNIEAELLDEAIRKKLTKPAYPGTRWLLIAIGVDLHQPIGEPPPFDSDPDPEDVFNRIFVYDMVHEAVFEKTGRVWRRVSETSSSKEVQ